PPPPSLPPARQSPNQRTPSIPNPARAASLATHPLDVVRTKLATQRQYRGGQPPRYRGTLGTLRRVFSEEGAHGLFRGITPAVVSHAPAAAIFFSTYSFLRVRVPERMVASSFPRDVCASSWAAGGAWITTCLLLNPLFVLKTKQQTQLVRANPHAPLKYTGLLSSFRVLVSEQGLRGLYAGTLAAMAAFPGAMIQMPLYEYLKTAAARDHDPSPLRIAMSSACSASTVGIVMYPIEVVRLRLQAQNPNAAHYSGIFDAFKKIFCSEGVHAFYRGLGTGLIRSVPQSAIGLSCYETVLRITSALMETCTDQARIA
ncbi:unnamed protein product, partial [Agarophyton chilense]